MLLSQAARTTSVGGYITYTPDQFGRTVAAYNGIPMLVADEDNTGSQILPFTEANPGGGAAASTSIYAVALGEGQLVGIQNGAIDVRDLGELDTKPVERTRVEWYAGMAIFHGKSVARLRGIKSSAVVV